MTTSLGAHFVYAQARAAWHERDFERCLELCAAGESAGTGTAFGSAVLRARVLLRLRRMREARELLEALDVVQAPSAEDAATATMLLGAAYARTGDFARGIAVLEPLAATWGSGPSPLRSEIATSIAYAAYYLPDHERALRALDDVDPGDGLSYVRALEIRGFIARAHGDTGEALTWFERAIAAMDGSADVDWFTEASVVMSAAYLSIELLALDRYRAIDARARRMSWDAPGLEYQRFFVEYTRSIAAEVEGRPREALAAARRASVCGPSPAYRLFGTCRRAMVLFSYGEMLGFEDVAAQVREDSAALDPHAGRDAEEVSAPVVVAETLAMIGDGHGAQAMLRRLDALPPEKAVLLERESWQDAYRAYVDGLVADAAGDLATARAKYREAMDAFRAMGLQRRMLKAALRLGELTGDRELLALVEHATRDLPATSWLRTRAARAATWKEDKLLARLTRAERDVLLLLYEGHSTEEVAVLRNRAPQTIRNTISKLLRTFGAADRQALIVACTQRGAFKTTP